MLNYNGTPNSSLHKRTYSSRPTLNDSITLLKENLTPEINRMKKWQFKSKYSHVIKKCEEKERQEKNKFLNLSKKKESNKTILEYAFMEEFNQNQSVKKNANVKVYEKSVAEKVFIEKDLEEKRYYKNMKELSELRSSPGMNPKSARIISTNEPDRLPVYLRSQEDIDKKKMKIENIRENLYLQGKTDDSYIKRSKSFNKGSFNNWVDLNQSWNKKKISKIENLKKIHIEQKQEEDRKELFFTPKINRVSELIVSVKNGKERSLTPVHEKLYKKHEEIKRKIEFKQSSLIPSFTPKINKYPNYIIRDKMNISTSKEFFFEAESAKLSRTTSKAKISTQNSIKNFIATSPVKQRKSVENGSPYLHRSKSVNDFSGSMKKPRQESFLEVSGMNLDNTSNLYNLNVRQNLSWKSPVNTILPKTPQKLKKF